MSYADQNRRSAQVVLASESGEALAPSDFVAANIERFAPDRAGQTVREEFERAGFTAGPVIGNNFSIEGPADLFEQLFGSNFTPGAELPLGRLPEAIRRHVRTVVVPRRPELMP
jgi:hypothetical protein